MKMNIEGYIVESKCTIFISITYFSQKHTFWGFVCFLKFVLFKVY